VSILVDESTRVICQGITGRQGTFHCERALASGTRIVGGVRQGKGGTSHLGVPVFDTVAEAIEVTQANASVIFVPPANAAEAIIEAADAGIGLVVCVTERIPVLDMVRVRAHLKGSNTVLVGPNTPGLAVPGVGTLGIMPQGIFLPGSRDQARSPTKRLIKRPETDWGSPPASALGRIRWGVSRFHGVLNSS